MLPLQNDNQNSRQSEQHLPVEAGAGKRLSLHFLQSVPEEEIWLAGQLSPHTRRAYKRDVAHFVQSLTIRSAEELRHVNRAAVIGWQNLMKERGIKPRTIRRRLSALSSLFTHLVHHRQ